MSHIWTFSPSSKEAVDLCIAAARPSDETNKWIQRFGLQNCIQSNITTIEINDEKSVINTTSIVAEPCLSNRNEDLDVDYYQEVSESIEEDPISRFDFLVTESLKDYKLLIHLANKLSDSCIEKIINLIYDNHQLDVGFVEKFHIYFVPHLLKKEHNCLTQDILLKSHRTYPNAFKMLLEMIIKDTDITNKVLEDLIQNFNETELSVLLSIITELELSTEEFVHNLFSIYTAYKGCKKTTEIQNLILTHILQNGQSCITVKNYGRLILAFLQTEKELDNIKDFKNIEKVVEMHRSPFRRPCMNLLQELLEKCNATMDTTAVNSETV